MNTQFDQTAADAFADKMLGVLNSGALALMTSLGHRSGLFDTMARLPPGTSRQIAEAAHLHERYVREWLGAMVTGGIVTYDPATQTYLLPAEHAASLTRAATTNNMAMFMQYIPLLGAVEDGILRSFRQGGGVPYAAYPRFQQIMAEESSMTVGAALLDSILPLAPELTPALQTGINVLDVGCGQGNALTIMARAFPYSRFTGYDFSQAGIATANARAAEHGIDNLRFVCKDAATMEDVEHYGLITAFDAIHDQAKPREVLRRIARALQPEGVFLMQDIGASSQVDKNIDHPMAPMLYTISCMHCMTVSLALDGEGLGAMWGEEQATELLAEAGLNQVTIHHLAHDIQNSYFVARKAA